MYIDNVFSRMKSTAKHLNSLVKEGTNFDDDEFRSSIREEWTQEFMDLVHQRKSL